MEKRLKLYLIGLGVILITTGMLYAGYYWYERYARKSRTQQNVVTQPIMSREIEEVGVVEIGSGGGDKGVINISAGQMVEFKNSGTTQQRLVINFDEPISESMDSGVSYMFRYPEGYREVGFSWNGGGVVLRRR